MLCADQWVLLNRGAAKSNKAEGNASIHYPLSVLDALLRGESVDCAPSKIQTFDLGKIHQVSLSFTDCAALPDGSWLYTAVAEDAPDSYQDGEFWGAVIGKVSPRGQMLWQRPLMPSCKVEGIAAHPLKNGADDCLEICLVTDADEPSQPALMLKAQLEH